VSVPGTEKGGSLLGAVAPIAGDSLQIRGLQLSVGDPGPLAAEARRGAVEDALAKARGLAEAAGVRLGRITSIDDGGATRSRNMGLGMMALASSAGTPVEAGTSLVTAHVTITMAIED